MGSSIERQTITGAGRKSEASSFPLNGALFSPCRLYRYSLWRTWNDKFAPLHFLLLNPSTADEEKNDPTVERCERRARSGGYGGLIVTNIFGWRSTDPKGLWEPEDPVGKLNDKAIRAAVVMSARTVCGWGSAGPRLLVRRRVLEIKRLLNEFPLWCLEKNADGSPKHPLYVKYSGDYKAWKEPHE